MRHADNGRLKTCGGGGSYEQTHFLCAKIEMNRREGFNSGDPCTRVQLSNIESELLNKFINGTTPLVISNLLGVAKSGHPSNSFEGKQS